MNTPTYKQQYDKVLDAYFRDEIKPMDSQFCFCGTIENGSKQWCNTMEDFRSVNNYSLKEIIRMEDALLTELKEFFVVKEQREILGAGQWLFRPLPEGTEKYENALFNGMCAALEVLKQIHIEKGEVIDESPVFTKRELQSSVV